MSRTLLLATRNRHKTRELATLLGPAFEVEDLSQHPELPEVEETGTTFAENAALKAVAASRYFPGLVLADDSGLEVDALEGAPGVRSARYAGEKASDSKNLELLLERMQGKRCRAARFRCAIAIAREGRVVATFDGQCEGRIIDTPRGHDGFGYDPVFVPEGRDETFAELPGDVKNAMSHRGRAMQQAIEWLRAQ